MDYDREPSMKSRFWIKCWFIITLQILSTAALAFADTKWVRYGDTDLKFQLLYPLSWKKVEFSKPQFNIAVASEESGAFVGVVVFEFAERVNMDYCINEVVEIMGWKQDNIAKKNAMPKESVEKSGAETGYYVFYKLKKKEGDFISGVRIFYKDKRAYAVILSYPAALDGDRWKELTRVASQFKIIE